MPKPNLTRSERKKYVTIEFTEKELRHLRWLTRFEYGTSVGRKLLDAKPKRRETTNVNDVR